MSVQGIHKHMTDQYPKEIHDIQKQVSDSDPVASDDRLSKIFASRTYDEYIPGKKPEAIGIVTMENLNSPSLEQAKEITHYIEYKEKK